MPDTQNAEPVLPPPQNPATGGDDLHQYVESFKASSDRARYALYAVIIATVLMAIGNYNFQSFGWPLLRIGTWYNYALLEKNGQLAPMIKDRYGRWVDTKIPSEILGGDPERLKVAREEYLKQFAARAVFSSLPIPGVSIDYNDLGILGGFALVLLMLTFVVCLMREHENLYLVLYKVRRLCSSPDHARSDSKANLLYHALAMSQALSSPPTLARWRNRGILHHFWLIFFLPLFVYAWVVRTNWKTAAIGETYGANMTNILTIQVGLGLALLALTLAAWAFSDAMAERWKRTFFRVNPSRNHVQQVGLWDWFRPIKIEGRDIPRRRVARDLVDTLTVADTYARGSVRTKAVRWIGGPTILNRDLKMMVEELFKKGRVEAATWCNIGGHGSFRELLQFTVETNNLYGVEWTVCGTWTFYYQSSSNERKAAVRQPAGRVVTPARGSGPWEGCGSIEEAEAHISHAATEAEHRNPLPARSGTFQARPSDKRVLSGGPQLAACFAFEVDYAERL